MPNWVAQRLTISGDNAKEALKAVLTKNGEDGDYNFDFNKVIPMPDDLNIISGTITNTCAKLFVNAMMDDCDDYKKYADLYDQTFSGNMKMNEEEFQKGMADALKYTDWGNSNEPMFKTKADVFAYGKKALTNVVNYGAKDWYQWSIDNWGTKWNACNTIVDVGEDGEPTDTSIYFETAWSPALPIIEKFAEMFPDCQFHYEWAEEQTGLYSGYMDCENGEVVDDVQYEECSKEAYEMHFDLWGENEDYSFNEKTGTYEYNEEVM